jgi:hypothetical protein
MKYIKSLGLFAVAAAMMAFASSASATTLTDSSGSSTPKVHFVAANKHIEIHNNIVNIQCNSILSGTVPTATEGGAGKSVSWTLATASFSECTNEWVVDTVAAGSLEMHYKEPKGTHNVGTLTSTGMKLTATRAGLSCIYETNKTPLGTVTGGEPATLAVSANIPRVGGSFLCGGALAAMTGTYEAGPTLKIDQ